MGAGVQQKLLAQHLETCIGRITMFNIGKPNRKCTKLEISEARNVDPKNINGILDCSDSRG